MINSLAQELRDRVQSHGFTARQLADISGYGQKHILKVFSGDQPGSIAFWQAMLDSCEVLEKRKPPELPSIIMCGPTESTVDYTGINSPTGRCPKHGDYLYYCERCQSDRSPDTQERRASGSH